MRIVEPIEAPPPFPERIRKSDRIPGTRLRRQRPVRGLHSSPGNLISKSDLGSYRYNASGASSVRPHALTRVDLNAGTGGGYRTFQYDANGNLTAAAQYDNSNNVIAARGRSGGYTSFNMPQFIDGPSISTSFAYGPEHQRVRQMSGSLGTTYYLNPGSDGELGYEKDIKTDGSIEERSFITAYGQVVAVMKRITQSGTTTYPVSYFHRDHLGSTTTVTNEAGAVVERLAYEAFGKRRFASGVQDPTGSIVPLNTDRGFANHEHIDELGVIHMNGRVYDPTIGRFMSPDPFIQDPYNLQAYNRYSYCMGNPVICMDPSGYKSWWVRFRDNVVKPAAAIAVVWFAPQISAYIGWTGGYITSSSALGATAVSGGLSASIGLSGAAASGILGGAAAGGILGGDFKSAVTGGITGGIYGGINNYYGNDWSLGRVAANATAGGVNARLQGGSFADGFYFNGLTSSARYLYNNVVNYDTELGPGGDAVNKRPLDLPVRGVDNIGTAGTVDPSSWWGEGGIVSRALNYVPGVNAVSGMHDVFQVRLDQWGGDWARNLLNVPGMAPAALVTYGALMNNVAPVIDALSVKKAR